ncbi:uncharacterized protein (DUF2267 family) [Nocardiopsis arvandica]|uniref:Uncharacterized protein (DUF2267 family) n=1 Tax=Nocardiopsis sinuspersici TaxID=501010 RepID=A0A7Y9XH58_9ACTN|nr:DUF2267 domain-containing protein [Nocardiopsis sinuspersici]NYH54580.1 uncharacterized protein (DUF2267 family) [Nocardiopsis sinuspersici]
MQHDTFIGQVQARAHLDSRGAAEEATRATLETLAERVDPGLGEDLAAQLPREIGENMRRVTRQTEQGPGAEGFDQQEFLSRVAQRAHSEPTAAAHSAHAVFDVLDEATTGGVMDKVRQALPEDLRRLTLQDSRG